MANPITTFIQNTFIKPQVEAQVAALAKDTRSFAVGASALPETAIADAIGQPHDTDYNLLYAIYRLHADVAACVARWAGGVTGNGWHLALMDEQAEPTDAQRRVIDETTTWLKNPNPHKRFGRLLYELVSHMAVTGDGYLNKVTVGGRVRELWSVHPATLRIAATEHGEIVGYVQRVNGKEAARFEPEEISHFPLPSIVNDLYGHSPLESVLEEVGTDLQAIRSNRALFENGFAPSAMLILDPSMSDTEVDKAIRLLKQQHTGAKHRHKLTAMRGVTDVKNYSHSLKDMEFQAMRSLTTEKVANAYGVPKLFLNQKDSADYATADVQERVFYNTTIKPLQDQIAEILTEEVIHGINPELRFVFNEPDFNNPNELRKDALVAHAQDKLVIDANELRTRFFNLEARDEADQPETTATDTQEQGADEATEAPATKNVTKAVTPEGQLIADEREAQMATLAEGIQSEIADYFATQQTQALDALPDEPTLANLDTYLDTALAGAEAALLAVLSGALFSSLLAGSQAAQLQVGITLTFDQINPVVQQYLNAQALTHVQGITGTTRDQLRAAISEGIAAGDGRDAIANRVRSVFTEATSHRAKTIASTETAQAFQYANHQAAQATGLKLQRTWITAGDDRVRPKHQELDGETVPFDMPYSAGIEPGEEFNCRCTETYEVVL